MLRAIAVIDFGTGWEGALPLMNSRHKATHRRRCSLTDQNMFHKQPKRLSKLSRECKLLVIAQKSYARCEAKPLDVFKLVIELCLKVSSPLERDVKNFLENGKVEPQREIKKLRRSRIPIIKVRWNSKRGPEFTWEREDQFREKYPSPPSQKTEPSKNVHLSLDQALLTGWRLNTRQPIFRCDPFWGCYSIDDLPIAEIYSGMDNLRYVTEGKLTFYKNKFSPQWRFLVHTILHCLSTKSGSWDQFGSSLAVALICLSDGRKFNWSSYIFKGMVSNIGNAKKFLMYPRFLQTILGIETSLPRQYQVFKLSNQEGEGAGVAAQAVPPPIPEPILEPMPEPE
ncbi:hypothetical protein Tco_0462344 [Tanacetum coccineum]